MLCHVHAVQGHHKIHHHHQRHHLRKKSLTGREQTQLRYWRSIRKIENNLEKID